MSANIPIRDRLDAMLRGDLPPTLRALLTAARDAASSPADLKEPLAHRAAVARAGEALRDAFGGQALEQARKARARGSRTFARVVALDLERRERDAARAGGAAGDAERSLGRER